MRLWRHLPLRCPRAWAGSWSPGPGRCGMDPVLAGMMWHRPGCGAGAGAAASRREGPAALARRAGCARSRRQPALPLAGRPLTLGEPHPCRGHAAGGAFCRIAHDRSWATPSETGLRPRWHHQHHGPCVPGQLERHETPDPVRSNAVNVRFHGVRHWRLWAGGGLGRVTRGTCAPREARGLVRTRGGRYRCERGRSPDGR
jgi:hypothetical protein